MKQLTKEFILKRLAKEEREHDKREEAYTKRAKKQGYERTIQPYRPSMKYYTRLEVFKNRNNQFNYKEMTAYSYNWWRYLQIIKGKVVFNDYGYSRQTNGHQSDLRQTLKMLGIKIDVVVHIRRGLEHLRDEALTEAYDNLFSTEIAITRGRENTSAQQTRISRVKFLKNEIKNYRLLGAKLSKRDVKTLRDRMYGEEAARIEEVKARKAFVKSAVQKQKNKVVVNDSLFDLNQTEGVQA